MPEAGTSVNNLIIELGNPAHKSFIAETIQDPPTPGFPHTPAGQIIVKKLDCSDGEFFVIRGRDEITRPSIVYDLI